MGSRVHTWLSQMSCIECLKKNRKNEQLEIHWNLQMRISQVSWKSIRFITHYLRAMHVNGMVKSNGIWSSAKGTSWIHAVWSESLMGDLYVAKGPTSLRAEELGLIKMRMRKLIWIVT